MNYLLPFFRCWGTINGGGIIRTLCDSSIERLNVTLRKRMNSTQSFTTSIISQTSLTANDTIAVNVLPTVVVSHLQFSALFTSVVSILLINLHQFGAIINPPLALLNVSNSRYDKVHTSPNSL